MENPNQNAPADKTPESPQEGSSEFLFFNVMPKEKAGGQIVEPQVSVETTPEQPAPTSSAFFTMVKKYKIGIFILVGFLIVGGTVYYFLWKSASKISQPDDLLVHNINTNKPPTPTEASSSPNSQFTVTTPKEWQKKFFNSEDCQTLTVCGDQADPDRDGLTNLQEQSLGTDPNNADSDNDGLADGDEVATFGSDPLKDHSSDPKYKDPDYITYSYDIKTNKKMTDDQISALGSLMRKNGLHQPSIATLDKVLLSVYKFDANVGANAAPTPTPTPVPTSTSTTSSTLPSNLDQSPTAKQDRDAQRSNTIKNIGISLIKYQADHQSFPKTSVFGDMVTAIKAYTKVAVNPVDPINMGNFVYAYSSTDGKDFTLSFYSETQNQLIKKHMAEALKDKADDQSSVYDDQRKDDLESLKSALLLYSNKNAAGNQDYVFPTVEKYKADIAEFIGDIPKDPQNGSDYEYKVSETFDTFTLKAVLSNPPTGTTGYLCNQEECRYY